MAVSARKPRTSRRIARELCAFVHEPEEAAHPPFANVAITALRARVVVRVDGNEVRGMVRYTRIWAKEESESWRVVGGHVSAVPGSKIDA